MTGFNILKADNPAISIDADASISGAAIHLFLPPGTPRTSLKASFSVSDKASVTVNGITQTSSATAVDFSGPVTYVVTAEDGSQQSYSVNLTTDISTVDQVVNTIMTNYNIPGLSLAITKNEKLVYVKSYGKADVENNQAAANNNLYRLASVSKQLTSIAIMKLLDQGKIHTSDKVFGAGAILGTDFGTPPYSPHITDITVDELLHHTSGGWPNDGTDPMFTNPTMTARQLIGWVLDNRPLDNVPGTAYAYSNFGYCVLGRVIEKITGVSYQQAVQSLVLQPSGISDMTIAGNTLADRITNEVKYYGQGGENPYIYNISRMDAHGGWLATATDMARVIVHVDGFPSKTDIISSNAISLMTAGSVPNPNYACGWSVNSANNWWHLGSLPGTATEDARTVSQGNFNFVILTNTRSLNTNFAADLDNIFWSAQSSTSVWPGYDLF